MKKIRITESQLKKIQEFEKNKIRNIKITESQLSKIKERIKSGELEQNIDKNFKKQNVLNENIDFVDFSREVMQAIQILFNNNSQSGLSPFWVKLGVTRGELAQFLLGCGLIYATTLLGGEVVYKIARKGFINGMKRLYNVIIDRRYDMKNKGNVIQSNEISEDGGYPAGAENDPNAPWNQDNNFNDEAKSEHNYFQVIKNFGDFSILVDPSGNKFYIDLSNLNVDPKTDDENLANKINIALENGELKLDGDGINLFDLNVISRITPGNKQIFIDNTHDFPEVLEIINDLSEMTTTGSVGGSYETPFFLSSNPEKGKFFDTPMIKGGKMIKKKSKISEDEKAILQRYSLTLQMLLYGNDEMDVKKQAFAIESYLNKKYDGNATISSLIRNDFGKGNVGESIIKKNNNI